MRDRFLPKLSFREVSSKLIYQNLRREVAHVHKHGLAKLKELAFHPKILPEPEYSSIKFKDNVIKENPPLALF